MIERPPGRPDDTADVARAAASDDDAGPGGEADHVDFADRESAALGLHGPAGPPPVLPGPPPPRPCHCTI